MQRFPKMEVFNLRIRCPWVLEDEGIFRIVHVWGPTIKTLRLDEDGRRSRTSTKSVTLKSVEYIALHCRHLVDLGIQFVGAPPRSVRSVYAQAVRPDTHENALRVLSLGFSPIDRDSVENMALYLSCLFPSLSRIEADEYLRDEGEPPPRHRFDRPSYTLRDSAGALERWRMVHALLPLLGLARRQERVAMTERHACD